MSSEYLSNRLIDTINSEKMHVGMENDDLYKEELKIEEQERLLIEEERAIQNEEMLYNVELKEFESRLRRNWMNIDENLNAKRLKLNIGGEKFELRSVDILKDEFSLFSVLLNENNKIHSENDGYYFFDRDWFLFRFIKSYMEHGSLPDKVSTLNSLYNESEFYHLENLKSSIKMKLLKMNRLPFDESISTLHANNNNNNNIYYNYNNNSNLFSSTNGYRNSNSGNVMDLYRQRNKREKLPDPFHFTKG